MASDDMTTVEPDAQSFLEKCKAFLAKLHRTHATVSKGDATIMDLPLTIVIVIAVLAPWLAAIAVVAAVVTSHQFKVSEPEPTPDIVVEGDVVAPAGQDELADPDADGDVPVPAVDGDGLAADPSPQAPETLPGTDEPAPPGADD